MANTASTTDGFLLAEKLMDFAIQTTVGSPQVVTANRNLYHDGAMLLLPMVAWEVNANLPFSSFETPPMEAFSTKENYSCISLPEYYAVDRVQVNIGGQTNFPLTKVDGNTFFNGAQSYITSFPTMFWWNNLEQMACLYPISSQGVIRIFGRKLIYAEKDGKPWLDPALVKPYVFEFLGYSLAKAIHIYYSLPWAQVKDANLENLQEQLASKIEQSFTKYHPGPSLVLTQNKAGGTIFTLGKGPIG